MTILLALVLPVLILAAWSLERRERAQEARDLRAAHEAERKQWWDERTMLLNRIKPETAQPILSSEIVAPPAVPFDDDEMFHEMTKDRLADVAMNVELTS